MAAQPLISVCLATYNQAPYIEHCLMSVLAQATDCDLEVLVGDDGSRDGTGERLEALAAQHPGRFRLVRRESNIGGTENYQDLVRRARGDYIAHLDGDDAWLPGKLRAQVAFLAAHPDCPAVYTNAIAVDAVGRLRGSFTDTHPQRMSLAYVATRGSFLMHSSVMYRARHRNVFLEPPPPVIDLALHLGLARQGPLGFIDAPLAMYRVATETSTVRNRFPLVQELLCRALEEAAPALAPADRREAAAHFAAEALIAHACGKTPAVGPMLRRSAAMGGLSGGALALRALPHVLGIGAFGLVRKLARRGALARLLAEHPRL